MDFLYWVDVGVVLVDDNDMSDTAGIVVAVVLLISSSLPPVVDVDVRVDPVGHRIGVDSVDTRIIVHSLPSPIPSTFLSV